MTTTYPVQTYTVFQQNQGQYYGSGQQISPASSTSPTSPRLSEYAPNPAKQLRPLKSPLYVPAVLRPTEHFPQASPMTPPKSLHGSLDSLNDNQDDMEEQAQINLALERDWSDDEDLGTVTGPPTREHWK